MASNITTIAQLSGEADDLLAVRFTVSKLVNSGTVWAGVAIVSGWLVGGRRQAAAASVLACLTALVVHYGVGQLLGQFDAAVWADNGYWLLLALIVGGPLGLIGAAARRTDWWGLVARLTVPIGAILEPFVVGMFVVHAILPWPDRVSSAVCGAVLVLVGIVGGLAIVRRYRRAVPTSG